MNQKICYEIFRRLADNNPDPKTELHYGSPFQLLVAAIFSAQSTDVGVNRVTSKLFVDAPTPKTMIALSQDALEHYIHSLGLYHTKAKNVLALCQILIERYHGEVPSTRDALESLPGVGRKTANIILNTIFGQPTIAVDTHVFRVANRIGIARGNTVRAVEDKLVQAVPADFRLQAHHWLVLLGRYVCKAQKPVCHRCVIETLCEYPDKRFG